MRRSLHPWLLGLRGPRFDRASMLCVGVVLLLAVGCSGIRVSEDYDHSTDFSKYRAWYWLPRPPPSGDPRIDSDLLATRVRSAVESILAAKGYRQVPVGEADFGVGWQAAIEGKLDVHSVDQFYGYGPRWGPVGGMGSETFVRRYDQGTLILDVVDARSRQLVWRGSAQAEVQQRRDPAQRDARVREAVQKILARFPPH